MEFTGERMIPEHNSGDIIYSEHLLRYSFAKQFVKGKTVLDVACGSGYGSQMLGKAGAGSVTGVDISEKAVAYANQKYKEKNTSFVVADGTKLPFDNNQFDVVVSFETIEHLEDHVAFVEQINRVLKQDGLLIISSPNKDVYPEGNEFHFKELTEQEFANALKKHFRNIQLLKQNNFLISSLYDSEKDIAEGTNSTVDSIDAGGMYFVAVCSNKNLPVFETCNLLASPSEISSQSVVAEREEHIKILKKEVEELKGHIDYFKSNTVDRGDYNRLELEHKGELDKNEYLYNSLEQDKARYEELLALLKEKENSLSELIEARSNAESALASVKEELTLTAEQKENLARENDKKQILIEELAQVKKQFDEELKKTEYLYRVTKEKEAEVSQLLKEINDLQELQFKFEAKKEEQKKKIDSLRAQRDELKEFEKKYIAEKEKTEYLYRLSIENDGKIKAFEGENLLLRQDKIQLLTNVENLSEELAKVQRELSMQLSENQKLQERCSCVDELKTELTDRKAKVEQLYESVSDLRIELFDSKSMIMRQNAQHEQAELNMHKKEEEIGCLSETIQDQLKDIAAKAELINEKDSFIHQIATELDQTKHLAAKFEEAMNDNLQHIHDLEAHIVAQNGEKNELEKSLSAKESHISLLDSKIEMYSVEVSHLRSSLSWKLTKPLRGAFDLLYKIVSPVKQFLKDIGYAFELLHREGIKSFVYRFFWYLRGKRLIEEIQYTKNKKFFKIPTKVVDNKAVITFDRVKKPVVSIIIPVYNQWDYTYNCLNSIYENTKGVDYEVIIADDVSDDETVNIKDYIKNIKVVRNKENLRFLLNCNNAAKRAKGDYVLFLNNDTCVHPNWLKELLSVFDRYENVGATGAKLVYEDGRLQEAGGIMWDDASGWNFGRLGDPQQPEYNYVKEVDYISGACLMIPAFLWKKLGGFDKHYVPAYYEDTDICFQIRNEGYKVILQPKSVVTHFEGVSHGTDLGSGQKKYQVANHKKFLEKWKTDLKTFHFKNAENVFLARERSRNKLQVLVIDHYVPHYDKDAGSRSTFSYLKLLVKMGCNVKFIGDNFYKHEPYTTELEQMGIEVLYGNHYFNHINDWLKENGKYFDYVFAHRMHIAPKYFEVLKKHSKAKIIYIGHDLQFIKSKKEYEFSKDEEHLRNHKKFKEIESAIFNTVDIIYPFSTYEAPLIQEIVPDKVVRPIPVYFFDEEYQQKNGFDQRKDILFVGGFGHPPNVDAVLWFAKEVFPLILQKQPDLVFNVLGSKPTKEIEALASENINVTGFVTDEELAEYYEKCRLSVVPLRVGAGVKGKLLETMYYKLPTVITSVAAEGVPGVENCCHIAEKAEDFAQKVISLYTNKDEWGDFSTKGADLIANYYSMNNAEELLKMDLV